ncbi:MAG: hypothetical protein Q9213_006810 [Squamulea squamosa]
MLAKRTMFANLGLQSTNIIGTIQPIGPAAPAMKFFYDVMFFCATQTWPQHPPPNNFIVKYGAFELAMFAAGAPIPWQWMAEFAHMMSQTTSMGFTNVSEHDEYRLPAEQITIMKYEWAIDQLQLLLVKRTTPPSHDSTELEGVLLEEWVSLRKKTAKWKRELLKVDRDISSRCVLF